MNEPVSNYEFAGLEHCPSISVDGLTLRCVCGAALDLPTQAASDEALLKQVVATTMPFVNQHMKCTVTEAFAA